MVRNLLKRVLQLSGQAQAEDSPVPDIGRVMNTENSVSQRREQDLTSDRDIELWRKADMDRLIASWNDAKLDQFKPSALGHFRRAVHDIHGASGLYGGEQLTRFTATLQTVSRDPAMLRDNVDVIDLLVQACDKAHAGNGVETTLVDQICDAIDQKFSNADRAA